MGTKFYRPARAYPAVLPANDVIMPAPPVVQPTPTGVAAWLQYLLPVVGGLGSLVFVFADQGNPLMMVAGITIAIGSVGGGLAMGIVQRYNQKKLRTLQQKLYLDYLKQYKTHLASLEEKQREVSKRLYPDYKDLLVLLEKRTYLWERRPTDGDFLTVRIGAVPAPLCRVALDLSTDMMVQYVPELRSQAEALVDKWRSLHDMSALIPLRSIGVLAVNGKRSDTRALVRALLCQIVAFQSPEDVRCMACFPQESVSEWSWLKWLPHTRRLRQIKAEKQHAPDHLCMLAHSIEDVNNLLLNQIRPELDRRRRLSEDKEKQQNAPVEATLPHLFVILDSFSPIDGLGQLPELDALFRDAAKFGVTVTCLVDDRSQEPTQIEARLSVASIEIFGSKKIKVDYEEIKLGGQRLEWVTADAVDPKICERMARCMAPLSLVEAGAQQDFSQDVRLLELLNLSAADAFDTAGTWRPRERSALLKVPIGLRGDGEPLLIDFKEAADKGMGPHGLVIGATGSGKSELLRTLVISLAITHDPQTVNFVLIDFKGGASFADFGALPHVAGIITNLEGDLSLVDRVYYSLLGEQQRRQRMLHDAGNLDNIKQYQAKWQMNPDMEPMPHLLIIADEFAELMANRPDFLELFITMGRVGRSLGLHLLFATQRLEEGRIRGLEGHLRYRICLRTFSAAESTSVLGTPDAYYLPSAPGVGYFKVDTNIYHMFKTALISVPYVTAAEKVSPRSRIRAFTSAGKLVKPQPQTSTIPSLPTQRLATDEPSDLHTEMDVVIKRLSNPHGADLAPALPLPSRHPVHQVWLPPLPKQLPLSTVLHKCHRQELNGRNFPKVPPFGTLCIPLGLLDMPQQQAQTPFILDFSGTGGHLALVGAPQSGKSTFLRMLIASFMLTHSPEAVQIYCIDLGRATASKDVYYINKGKSSFKVFLWSFSETPVARLCLRANGTEREERGKMVPGISIATDFKRATKEGSMEKRQIISLEAIFDKIQDPRIDRTKLHKLIDIIIIAICAVICGAEGWEEIEQFGKEKQEWLENILELPNGIPSHDTISRVFSKINPQEFEKCFFEWTSGLVESISGVVAIDGKTHCRSYDRSTGKKALHMVSAWAAGNRLVLAQIATEQKSNEITAIPELLRMLDLSGCIVTIDAMGTQKKVVKQIVEQKGDFALALKKNQGTLYRKVEEAFEKAKKEDFANIKHEKTKTEEKGHGREETRSYWIIDDQSVISTLDPNGDWEKLRSIGMVESKRIVGEKTTKQVKYYILSIEGIVEIFSHAVREHWGIENRVHWILDVAFREDLSRIREGHSAHNFGVLRHIALNLLQKEKTTKVGTHAKRLKAGWNTSYLEKVLMGGNSNSSAL